MEGEVRWGGTGDGRRREETLSTQQTYWSMACLVALCNARRIYFQMMFWRRRQDPVYSDKDLYNKDAHALSVSGVVSPQRIETHRLLALCHTTSLCVHAGIPVPSQAIDVHILCTAWRERPRLSLMFACVSVFDRGDSLSD